jgi:uncharacterized protein
VIRCYAAYGRCSACCRATGWNAQCCSAQARGDDGPDFDYDIAIFLRDYHGLWDEAGPLADATTEILYDTGAVLTPIPFPAGAYLERTALMNEIKREGIDL